STPRAAAPLPADFGTGGLTGGSLLVAGDGQSRTRTLFAGARRPLRAGTILIPPLVVGDERSSPVTLVVAPESAQEPAGAGADVFLESLPDDPEPYAQQAVDRKSTRLNSSHVKISY